MLLASSLHIAVTLVALVPAAQAQIDEVRPPADRGTPPERILEQGNAQAPASLRVVARCSDVNLGARVAEFTWVSPVTDARAQLIDISMFRDGFQSGAFRDGCPSAHRSELIGVG